MANTRLFLDTRNAKDGRPCVLKIAIAQKKKTAYISLDAKLVPGEQWDFEKEKVVNHPDKQVLNTYSEDHKKIWAIHSIGHDKKITGPHVHEWNSQGYPDKPYSLTKNDPRLALLRRVQNFQKTKK